MVSRSFLALVATVVCLPLRAAEEAPARSRDFFKRHCVTCHSGRSPDGGFDAEGLRLDLSDPARMASWIRVFNRVSKGEMPPPDADPPPAAERSGFLSELEGCLTRASLQRSGTVLRRLNRFEYENTLNDLLGTRISVSGLFPEDGRAHGFDTVGEGLDISPVQLQRYMDAAAVALDAAATPGPRPDVASQAYVLDSGRNASFIGKHWLKRKEDGAVVFFYDGYPAIELKDFRARHEGHYRTRVHAAAHQSERPVIYGVYFGADSPRTGRQWTLAGYHEAGPGGISIEEFDAYLWAGDSMRLRPYGLKNRSPDVVNKVDQVRGAGLAVLKVEVEGPFFDEWPGKGHRLVYGDLQVIEAAGKGRQNRREANELTVESSDPQRDLERLLRLLAEKAFRRPVTAGEVAEFVELGRSQLADGADFGTALRMSQVAILCSPDFLYLQERPGRLDGSALASRLSYMLWRSLPDAELLGLAAEGRLSEPAVLRAQTERLLSDPKASRFVADFTGQWLNLSEIDATTPDQKLYPEFDDFLRDSMIRETEMFFSEVLRENLSLLSFVDSDWTLLNRRLADHYGIEGVEGAAMHKVSLRPEHRRGGVLTHASVLKVTANGTTTSPVTRGAWVLERILGEAAPPPPPGVPGVEPDIRGATTLREQLEKHRSTESCNSCHKVIDPPGLALESYDVIGGWRDHYRSLGTDFPRPAIDTVNGRKVQWRVGPPVDCSGVTAEGSEFADLAEYKRHLLANPDRLASALAEKLATFGTGRGMGFSDRAQLRRIVREVASKGYGFRDLLHEVVQSDLFRNK